VDSYNIYRSTASGSEVKKFSVSGATAYVDSPLDSFTTYYYKVSAVNTSGEGDLSNEVAAKTLIGAPTGLTAVAGDHGQAIVLRWAGISLPGTAYNVYRGLQGPGSESALLTPTPISDTTLTTEATEPGVPAYYIVVAVNGGLISSPSNESSCIPTPPDLTGLDALAGDGSVLLHWTTPAFAAGYDIYRSTSSESGYQPIKRISDGSVSSYLDSGLDNGTVYYYKVTPLFNHAVGVQSNYVYATWTPSLFSVNPGSITVSRGKTMAVSVDLNDPKSFTDTLSLSLSGPSASGLSVYLYGTLATFSGSEVLITADGGVQPGTYSCTVVGTRSSGSSSFCTFNIVVP
jgi:fibronectin type 3 domain-containing protein